MAADRYSDLPPVDQDGYLADQARAWLQRTDAQISRLRLPDFMADATRRIRSLGEPVAQLYSGLEQGLSALPSAAQQASTSFLTAANERIAGLGQDLSRTALRPAVPPGLDTLGASIGDAVNGAGTAVQANVVAPTRRAAQGVPGAVRGAGAALGALPEALTPFSPSRSAATSPSLPSFPALPSLNDLNTRATGALNTQGDALGEWLRTNSLEPGLAALEASRTERTQDYDDFLARLSAGPDGTPLVNAPTPERRAQLATDASRYEDLAQSMVAGIKTRTPGTSAATVRIPAQAPREAAQAAQGATPAVRRILRPSDREALRRAIASGREPPPEVRRALGEALAGGDDAAAAAAVEALGPRPADPVRASNWDALLAFMTSNLLSNPRSLVGNALGGVEQGLGRAATRIAEGRPKDIWTELTAAWAARGDILRAAGRQFVTGERPPAVGDALRSAQEATDRVAPAFAGKRGMVATPALRVAGATDALFAMSARAGAEAVADARGLTGRAREAFVTAQTEQSVLTQAPSSLAKMIGESRRLLASPDPLDKLKGAAVFAYIPVVRIPETIWRQGVRRAISPVTDLPLAGVQALRGKPQAAQQALRSWATNSTVAGLAAWQVGEGNLTGSGPQDPDERRRWEAQGWRPNSFRVGGDWYSYDWLGPLGLQLNLVATFAETLRAQDRAPTLSELTRYREAFDRTAAVAYDEHYLRNFFRVLESIGQGRATDALTQGALELGGRLVPYSGALNWAAGGLDPLEREAQTPLDRALARTPLRGLLEPVVDPTTGGPLARGGTPAARLAGFGRVLPEASPARAETARLASLRGPDGAPLYAGVQPRAFDEREVTYAGAPQTPAQRRLLQAAYGAETGRYLGPLLTSAAYLRASDADKAAMVQRALRTAAKEADIRAGDRIARDPKNRAAWEYLAVPHYAGVDPQAAPDEIRRQNLRIAEAKQQLEAFRARYPQQPTRGEAEFAQADREAYALAKRPPVPPAYLAARRAAIKAKLGVTPDEDPAEVLLAGTVRP